MKSNIRPPADPPQMKAQPGTTVPALPMAQPGTTVPGSDAQPGTTVPVSDAQPGTTVPGSDTSTRNHGAFNPEPPCAEPGTMVRLTRNHGSLELDELDQQQELEDLAARGSELEEPPFRVVVPTSKNIPPAAEFSHPEEKTKTRYPPAPADDPPAATYADLARQAIADANAERDDSSSNILRHFDRRCRDRGLGHWMCSEAAGEGLSQAFVGRERAQHGFLATLHRVAGRRPS